MQSLSSMHRYTVMHGVLNVQIMYNNSVAHKYAINLNEGAPIHTEDITMVALHNVLGDVLYFLKDSTAYSIIDYEAYKLDTDEAQGLFSAIEKGCDAFTVFNGEEAERHIDALNYMLLEKVNED
jgi:hypothetical protein